MNTFTESGCTGFQKHIFPGAQNSPCAEPFTRRNISSAFPHCGEKAQTPECNPGA
jgi:hypothetical protein